MKNTKILVAVIITWFATWLLVTTVCYLLTDLTFKESAKTYPVVWLQIFLGWIPSVFVGQDLNNKLE